MADAAAATLASTANLEASTLTRILDWCIRDDQVLLQHVAQCGPSSWTALAEKLSVIPAIACARWCCLCAQGQRKEWSAAELAVVIKAHLQARPLRSDGRLGAQAFYTALARFLPARSASAVRQVINVKLVQEMKINELYDSNPSAYDAQTWQAVYSPWLSAPEALMLDAEAKLLAELALQRLDAPRPDASAAPGSAEAPAASSGGSDTPFGAGSSGAALRQALSCGSGALQSQTSGSRPCTPEPLPAEMELQGAPSAPVASMAPAHWPLPRYGASQSLAHTGSAPLQLSCCYSTPAAQAGAAAATDAITDALANAVGRKRKLSSTGREMLAAMLAPSTAAEGWHFDAAAAAAAGDGQLLSMPVDWLAAQCALADAEMATADAAGVDQGAGRGFAGSGAVQQCALADGTAAAAAEGNTVTATLDPSAAGGAAGFAAIWSCIQDPGGSSMAPAKHVPQQQSWGLANPCLSAPLQAVAGSNQQQQDRPDEHLMTVATLGALQLQSLSPAGGPAQAGAGQPTQPGQVPAHAPKLPTGAPQASVAPAAAAAGEPTAGPLLHAEANPAALAGGGRTGDTEGAQDQCARGCSADPRQTRLEAVDPIEHALQQLEDGHALPDNGRPGNQAQALSESFSLGQLLWADDSTGGLDGPAPSRVASVTSAALEKALQREVPAGPSAAAENPLVAAGVAAQGTSAGLPAAEGAAHGSAQPAAAMAGANRVPGGGTGVDCSLVGSCRMGLQAVSNMLDSLQQQLEPKLTAAPQARYTSAQQHQDARMLLVRQQQQQQQAMRAAGTGASQGMQRLQQQRLHGLPLPRLPAYAGLAQAPGAGTAATAAGVVAAVPSAGMCATPDASLIALQLAHERNMGLAMPSPWPLSAPAAAAAGAGSGSFGRASSAGADMSAGGSMSAATIEEKVIGFKTTLGAMQDMIGGIYKMFTTLGTRPGAQAVETHRLLLAQINMLERQLEALLQQMQEEGLAGTLTMQRQQVPRGVIMGGSLGPFASSLSATLAGPMGGLQQGIEMQMQQQQLPHPAGSWAHTGFRPMQ